MSERRRPYKLIEKNDDMKILSCICFHINITVSDEYNRALTFREIFINFSKEQWRSWLKIVYCTKGLFVFMIPLSRDEMRGGVILVYRNKSRLMIQQNITIFLGVDYAILGN